MIKNEYVDIVKGHVEAEIIYIIRSEYKHLLYTQFIRKTHTFLISGVQILLSKGGDTCRAKAGAYLWGFRV